MNTEKKTIQYEFSENEELVVEEPFIKYAALNLDESKRYTYADYLTWMDDKEKVLHQFILQPDGKYDEGTIYQDHQKAPMYIFDGLEIDLNELFE